MNMTDTNVCELRIVLLGKNRSKNSRVGNIILDRDAFESKKTPSVFLEKQSVTVRGRQITVINDLFLLRSNLSQDQIQQRVTECVSSPVPYVIMLILQLEDFRDDDSRRVKCVLAEFSEQAMKHTIVLTTDEGFKQNHLMKNNSIQKLINKCEGRHLHLDEDHRQRFCMFKMVQKILKDDNDQFVMTDFLEEADKDSLLEEKTTRSEGSTKAEFNVALREAGEHQHRRREDKQFKSVRHRISNIEKMVLKLNLVLCGHYENIKTDVSNLILGRSDRRSESSSECVRREGKACGRLITLVELPALFNTELSEEERMHQTLQCVSLCDPGVHAFLLIIPALPLTDEDKAEIEHLKEIFYSRNFILLSIAELAVEEPVTNFGKSSTEYQRIFSFCRGQYRGSDLKKHGNSTVQELLDYIENMRTEPYSVQMYLNDQKKRVRHELEKHKDEMKRMEKTKELRLNNQSEGCLRIVLIGKTGNGKSETGNTILGREEFNSEPSTDSVTTVCIKGVCEVEGRAVAVVDTPGLFDTIMPNEIIQEEIAKCVSLSAPGPHAFIFVLSVGRFTKEETDTLDLIQKIFGPKAAQFSIVLFTRGDDLRQQSIEQFVEKSKNTELKKLIKNCGNRLLVFNNREKKNRAQVTRLVNMIEEVKKLNQGQHFTNSMFEEAEINIKKRIDEILQDREREIQAQNEELKAKYEIRVKDMKKRFEEEKQKADKQEVPPKNEFKIKNEGLKKVFEENEKMEQKYEQTKNEMKKKLDNARRAAKYSDFREIEDKYMQTLQRELEEQETLYKHLKGDNDQITEEMQMLREELEILKRKKSCNIL